MIRKSCNRPAPVTEKPADLSGVAVAQVVADALNRYVGPNRAITPDDLSKRTGLSRRAITAFRSAEYSPKLCELLRILRALDEHGPTLANELLALADIGGAERIAPSETHPATVIASLVDEARELAMALEDGVFDHRDRAAAAKRLADLGVQLQEAAAAYAGPRAVA